MNKLYMMKLTKHMKKENKKHLTINTFNDNMFVDTKKCFYFEKIHKIKVGEESGKSKKIF